MSLEPLLRELNDTILSVPRLCEFIPEDVVASGWLGNPGAEEAQIQQAEERLGVTLPPSYKDFLRVSNGGWFIDFQDQGKYFSTEEVKWFRENYQWLIDDYLSGIMENYKVYEGLWDVSSIEAISPTVSDENYFQHKEDGQGISEVRIENLPYTLQITDFSRGPLVYLLDSKTVSEDGEWEVWSMGLGDIFRYRSFEFMLRDSVKSIRNVYLTKE